MELFYRGVSYDYKPRVGNIGQPVRPLAQIPEPYTLIYRGVKIQVDPKTPLKQDDIPPGVYNLRYRSNAYRLTVDAQGGKRLETDH